MYRCITLLFHFRLGGFRCFFLFRRDASIPWRRLSSKRWKFGGLLTILYAHQIIYYHLHSPLFLARFRAGGLNH